MSRKTILVLFFAAWSVSSISVPLGHAGGSPQIVKASPAPDGAPPEALAGTILFGTVFDTFVEPGAPGRNDVPVEVLPRIEALASRSKAFRSRLELPELQGPLGPEVWAAEKRLRMERDMVALIATPGIEEAASDYAASAVLAYEWEGLSEPPLKEAAFAEEFLKSHPATPLKSYLNLFIAHRYRCATEILRGEKGQEETLAHAAAKYRTYLEAAMADPDPLVRLVAADMEKRPYLYLEETRPSRSPAHLDGSAEAASCPDAAFGETIQDPRAWALRCFGISAGPEAAKPGTLSEFHADLYGDGDPAIFIGSMLDRGNAGGTHYVFRQVGSAYRYLGSIFLHPKAFKVLRPDEDGRPSMIRYIRLGSDEGRLESVVYDGKAFVVVRSETVFPQGKDRSRLCELFGLMCREDPGPGVATSPAPALSLRQALDVAEDYVKGKKIDLGAQHLHSIVLRYDEGAKAPYWNVQWMWSEPRLGGEFGLRVYMDGKVIPAPLGP